MKPHFELYKLLRHSLCQLLRKSYKGQTKKMSDDKVLGMVLKFAGEQHWSTLDTFIHLDEFYWLSHGRHVLFPEMAETWQNLLDARYDPGQTEHLQLPLASFIVAMPPGFLLPSGVPMPPLLVTCIEDRNEFEDNLSRFAGACGLANYPQIDSSRDKRVISICYVDPTDQKIGKLSLNGKEHQFIRARASLPQRLLPDILQSESAQEFKDRMPQMDGINYLIPLDPHDLEIQFHAFKLVAGMMVCHSVQETPFLSDGLPTQQRKAPMSGFNTHTNYIFHTFGPGHPSVEEVGSDVCTHARRWHFRNLRAPIYYRGKHENQQPGSRWIFVRDALVKGQGHTASKQSSRHI